MPHLSCLNNRQVLRVVNAEFLVCLCGGGKDALEHGLALMGTRVMVGLLPLYLGLEISGGGRGS